MSKKQISNPHDRFFRGAMSNPQMTLEFLQSHLPASIMERIDPDSIKLTQGTFIDEELHQWMSDVLYKATFHGAQGYIYLLIEHQRKADPLMPLRLLEYTLKIFRMHLREHGNGRLPLIYPCVLFNGEDRYCYTMDFFELFEDAKLAREIFLKPFQLIDLSQICDDDLKKKPLVGMLEMFLKHAFTRDAFVFLNKLGKIIQNLEARNEEELLKLGFCYLLETQEEKETILEIFQTTLSPKNKSTVMTIAESLVEEGRQEGLQEGIEQGYRSLLTKQIQRCFPKEITDRHLYLIEEADSETLALWIENLMKASYIEEVFVWQR